MRYLSKLCGFLILLVIAVFVMVNTFLIEQTTLNESVRLPSGAIDLEIVVYRWRSYGSPHAILIGGGTIAVTLKSLNAVKPIKWRSFNDERCFFIAEHLDGYCLASYDRSMPSSPKIVGYKLDGDGKCLASGLEDVSLIYAIQNLWMDDHTERVLSDFNPSSDWVQRSLTARLWWKIKNGRDVTSVPETFIREVLDSEFRGNRNLSKAR